MELSEFLYEENGFLYYRNDKGRISKVIKNKFNDKEIVSTTEKHHSPKSFTRLLNPRYVEERGWIYAENYINYQGSGSGTGHSFNEKLFKKLTSPREIYTIDYWLKANCL